MSSIHRPSVIVDHLLSFMAKCDLASATEGSEVAGMLRAVMDKLPAGSPERRMLEAGLAYIRGEHEDGAATAAG